MKRNIAMDVKELLDSAKIPYLDNRIPRTEGVDCVKLSADGKTVILYSSSVREQRRPMFRAKEYHINGRQPEARCECCNDYRDCIDVTFPYTFYNEKGLQWAEESFSICPTCAQRFADVLLHPEVKLIP